MQIQTALPSTYRSSHMLQPQQQQLHVAAGQQQQHRIYSSNSNSNYNGLVKSPI